jgi:GMP synthase-like glutamine amidotransferase
MRIHVFQHIAFEGLAAIYPWAESRRHSITYTRFYAGEKPALLETYDWLIIMGGPMGVNDEAEYPWLKSEKMAIGEALKSGRIILGICLGAQLLAHVLGAQVSRNEYKEIGWHPVLAVTPNHWASVSLNTFQWHGDTFSLPPNAIHLASSKACQNQGFIWQDKVVGLQFHPEATSESIAALIKNCASDMTPGPFVQSQESLIGNKEDFEANHKYLHQLLSGLEASA